MDTDNTLSDVTTSLGNSRCFVNYSDDEQQKQLISEIRKRGAIWIDVLEGNKLSMTSPLSSEQARLYALAMTTIEEAVMWSIKAICK